MPSEIAQKIVDQIFGDEKAKAVDSVNDALAAASYDAIQAKHRTQTPNTNQTIAFFSYGYLFTPHTQYPIDLN